MVMLLEQWALPAPMTHLLLLMVRHYLAFSLNIHPPVLTWKFPNDSSEALSVSCDVVVHAIRGFRAGSAGGLDCLWPQNFKELISKSTGWGSLS